MKRDYAIIVRSKTRLEQLIERFNTKAQAAFYIERSGGHFEDYEQEHGQFYRALDELQSQLSPIIKYKIIDRSFLPNYLFTENNLIIVIGQDGLLANTAKYANNCPIIGVNPDPARYDGILLPFHYQNAVAGVRQLLESKFRLRKLHFAEAKLNNGQRLLGFNDLFIGASSHVSARYQIGYQGKIERHSSSGIIISTQAGSTGWMSSVFNMVASINGMHGRLRQVRKPQLAAEELLFAVREPFISQRTQAGIVFGRLKSSIKLELESFMPSNGVIFSDGIEQDFLPFNSGASAQIGLAKEQAALILPAA